MMVEVVVELGKILGVEYSHSGSQVEDSLDCIAIAVVQEARVMLVDNLARAVGMIASVAQARNAQNGN